MIVLNYLEISYLRPSNYLVLNSLAVLYFAFVLNPLLLQGELFGFKFKNRRNELNQNTTSDEIS